VSSSPTKQYSRSYYTATRSARLPGLSPRTSRPVVDSRGTRPVPVKRYNCSYFGSPLPILEILRLYSSVYLDNGRALEIYASVDQRTTPAYCFQMSTCIQALPPSPGAAAFPRVRTLYDIGGPEWTARSRPNVYRIRAHSWPPDLQSPLAAERRTTTTKDRQWITLTATNLSSSCPGSRPPTSCTKRPFY